MTCAEVRGTVGRERGATTGGNLIPLKYELPSRGPYFHALQSVALLFLFKNKVVFLKLKGTI